MTDVMPNRPVSLLFGLFVSVGELLNSLLFCANRAVVSLPLICSFSRMKSHLGLDADVKPETVPEETVLAVAEVLRPSLALRVSEDGKPIPALPSPFFRNFGLVVSRAEHVTTRALFQIFLCLSI